MKLLFQQTLFNIKIFIIFLKFKIVNLKLCKVILPTKTYEESLRSEGYKFIAGVDEAGRGAWACPIVAAAVIMPCDFFIEGICDSKLIKEEKREELALKIKKTALSWAVGIVDVDYINKYNIGPANVKVFELAVAGLKIKPDYVMVDGLRGKNKVSEIQGYADEKPHTDKNPFVKNEAAQVVEYIKDGDAKIYSIAVASILAKTTRDEILRKAHLRFPQYGFDKHKGYGTKLHQEALEKYGICEIHRILYKPIKRIVDK